MYIKLLNIATIGVPYQLEAPKSLHWVACGTRYTKKKSLNWVVLNCSVPVNFFKWASLKPFEGPPTCRASRGPLAQTFTLS